MAAAAEAPCPCDCGDPRAGRVHLCDQPAFGGQWLLCTCTSCGPAGEGRLQQCTVQVDPIVGVFTGRLVLCEDCRQHCELVRRREAVLRARFKRKHQGESLSAKAQRQV